MRDGGEVRGWVSAGKRWEGDGEGHEGIDGSAGRGSRACVGCHVP